MRICAVIISSYTREDLIGEAIETVPWADKVLLAHITNMETVPDKTLRVCQAYCGDRLMVIECGVIDGASHARNAGLECAGALGYDWAVQLDTDERINWKGVNIPGTLADVSPEVQVLSMWKDDLSYHKGRFFRLPARGRFHGFSHEDWRPMDGVALMPQAVTFSEVVKLEAQIIQDLQGQLIAIRRDMEAEPHIERWRAYHQDCLNRLQAFESEAL